MHQESSTCQSEVAPHSRQQHSPALKRDVYSTLAPSGMVGGAAISSTTCNYMWTRDAHTSKGAHAGHTSKWHIGKWHTAASKAGAGCTVLRVQSMMLPCHAASFGTGHGFCLKEDCEIFRLVL
jgi:hypothetical protein